MPKKAFQDGLRTIFETILKYAFTKDSFVYIIYLEKLVIGLEVQ